MMIFYIVGGVLFLVIIILVCLLIRRCGSNDVKPAKMHDVRDSQTSNWSTNGYGNRGENQHEMSNNPLLPNSSDSVTK